jgi:N-acetylglucosamine-6-sulfatase/uncharacterized sulfatase
MNNLHGNPEYADVIADLKEQLKAVREKYDETDEDSPVVQGIIDRHWETTPESEAEAIRISNELVGSMDAYAEKLAAQETADAKSKSKSKKKMK